MVARYHSRSHVASHHRVGAHKLVVLQLNIVHMSSKDERAHDLQRLSAQITDDETHTARLRGRDTHVRGELVSSY